MSNSYTRTGLFTGSYLTGPLPTVTPRFIGQMYIVTEGKHYDPDGPVQVYIAHGTSSYKDWVQDHLFSSTLGVAVYNPKAGDAVVFDTETGLWRNKGGNL